MRRHPRNKLSGWAGAPYPGERGEAVQLLYEAEHLQADGRHDDEEAGGEHHQAAEFFTGAEYLVHKVLQSRGDLDQTHDTQHLRGEKQSHIAPFLFFGTVVW